MQISVIESYNVTPNIFVFMRKESVAEGQPGVDTFESVASPVDIEEYPVENPEPDVSPAFYRLSSIDLLSRNRELLDITWDAIKQDCDELVLTLANICELEADDTHQSGYLPGDEVEDTDSEGDEPEGEGSSAGPEVCPVDSVASLTVQTSNDPNFPTSAVLAPSGATGEPPTCTRTWLLTGVVDGTVLKIETSTTENVFTAYLDDVEVDSGGLADGYIALLTYEKAPGDERNLSISAT
jgi:hypothetical protein